MSIKTARCKNAREKIDRLIQKHGYTDYKEKNPLASPCKRSHWKTLLMTMTGSKGWAKINK